MMKKLVYVVISIILFAFGIIYSFILGTNVSLTVLPVSYSKESIHPFKFSEIYANEKFVGNFIATENNLGIIAVRFFNFGRINDDTMIFRIKEESDPNWYYENRYKVDQFLPDEPFTFGFPLIQNSFNKRYIFELESMSGSPGNAVGLSEKEPLFLAEYQFSKSEIFNNPQTLTTFLFKKARYLYSNPSFVLSSFIYFLPFLFFVAYITYLKKHVAKNIEEIKANQWIRNPHLLFFKFKTMSAFIGVILLASFVFDTIQGVMVLIFYLVWWGIIYTYRLNPSASFIVAFLFLFMCPLLMILKLMGPAENNALLAYHFLVFGLVHSFYEIRFKNVLRRLKNAKLH